MAIALGGRPDDSAKMVWSRGCIAYLCKRPRKGNAISIRAIGFVGRPAAPVSGRFRSLPNRPAPAPDFGINSMYYRYLVDCRAMGLRIRLPPSLTRQPWP